ncbi:ribonuclease E activity regulator RraA [Sphingomonas bisphenolicum]|uniref:4-hydroxy-4-methyl-2-oxoglutarate aldolase n=1 Tax=Sphingomonas bisphenolicum TaxID=296544 RepID=A0ABM7G476_9SPHN|nr:ribonuclease E activity regulator RraA [Sphingomonas bisphenolicum]BBF69809.1 putative 4-hydroxy-4-methyl-2-oxoglutarate aldolase [Sphingomonas bisphenolicum]
MIATCDLYDRHEAQARVPDVQLVDFGGRAAFSGIAVTARCHEDNSVVKSLAAKPGTGKILVVDGGSSLRCALLGDMIAQNAVDNGWEGIIILGAVRDRAALATMDIGVKALGTTPRKSVRQGVGEVDIPIEIGGVTIMPADQVFADADGILILTPTLEDEAAA